MCGIVAAVSKQGGISGDAVGRATRRLRHRGPDAQRVWVAQDGRVGLGHARLSIIDLETGDQPIANEDGRLRTVVNGESTTSSGSAASSSGTDTSSARGRTARSRCTCTRIAARGRSIRCGASSRSRSGTRATGSSSRRATASASSRSTTPSTTARSILRPRPRRSPSSACRCAGIAKTLYDIHFVAHPPDRTLFKGIYQLPPASYLLTDGEHVSVMPYWDWDYPVRRRDARERRRARVGGAARSTRSRKRSACVCARTCRSPAT